jgi:hypothetical protein
MLLKYKLWSLSISFTGFLIPPCSSRRREYLTTHDRVLQSVSTAEAGFYKCVSKGLTDPSFNIQGVELVVKKDWEEVWETDTEVCSFMKFIP